MTKGGIPLGQWSGSDATNAPPRDHQETQRGSRRSDQGDDQTHADGDLSHVGDFLRCGRPDRNGCRGPSTLIVTHLRRFPGPP
jgi:hypothetical protein